MFRRSATLALTLMLTLPACSRSALTDNNLLAALNTYFAGKKLCTQNYTLPADLTRGGNEFMTQSDYNSELAPYEALKAAGLLTSKPYLQPQPYGAATPMVRYALANPQNPDVLIGSRADTGTGEEQHYVQFCYGHVQAQRVTQITKQTVFPGAPPAISGTYTYSVAIEPWATNPKVRKAFPQIDDAQRTDAQTATAGFEQNQKKEWVVDSTGIQN